MMTDLQFVWPGLKLGVPESRSGLIAGMGGMSYLSSVVGPVRGLRLNVLGELISSEMAASYGLISHLSESPFSDALALRDADFDFDAAMTARKVITGTKYELLKKDIDIFCDFLCSGKFLARQSKIRADYEVMGYLESS